MRLYISSIKHHLDLRGAELVTKARQKRIQAYIRPEDKARCLAAGLLLRRFCGVTDDSQLVYGENGKPYLKDGGIYFSISHSGGYAVLVTAGREVGADIEKIAPYSDSVAARCFTPAEYEWLREQGSDEAFYHIWTAKESILKASGTGLTLPPQSFCTLSAGSSPYVINDRTFTVNRTVHDGHIICWAVCGK
jgi:4'-phosphopantetheinyl transferase